MKHPARSLLAALIVGTALFAFPAWAKELGQVQFTFDGEDQSWFTMTYDVGGTPRPSARVRSSSMGDTVDIDAFPEADSPTLERLSLTWMYPRSFPRSNPPDYTRAFGFSITWLPGMVTGPQWVSRNEQLDLTTVDLEGNEGHVTGTFTAELCYVEELYGDPDESTCQPISGAIDTRIGRRE